jgi:hypothetical protein
VTIFWDDANTGDAAATTLFRDRVLVRNLTSGQTLVDVLAVYDAASEGAIAARSAKTRQHSFRLPDGAAGTGTLLIEVTADAQNELFEYNAAGNAEANNRAARNVVASLAAYPDLVVTRIKAPANGASGQTVQVVWVVTNGGTGEAAGTWTDQVFLSSDAVLGSDQFLGTFTFTGRLGAGQSVTNDTLVSLPAFGAGAYYFVVRTDAGMSRSTSRPR